MIANKKKIEPKVCVKKYFNPASFVLSLGSKSIRGMKAKRFISRPIQIEIQFEEDIAINELKIRVK